MCPSIEEGQCEDWCVPNPCVKRSGASGRKGVAGPGVGLLRQPLPVANNVPKRSDVSSPQRGCSLPSWPVPMVVACLPMSN
jgi:hypothetical protein